MRKSIIFLFSLGVVFAATFSLARFGQTGFQKWQTKPTSSTSQTLALKNHPFVVFVVGHNNGATVYKTLHSIFDQNYSNFRVIYIDDASTDGSIDFARDIVFENGSINVEFIQNEKRMGTLASLFRSLKNCAKEEIVMVLNEHDFLAHEWVLQKLNVYYNNPDVWMALSQYVDYPTFQRGKEGVFPLKSFYATLFQQLRETDFIYGEKWIRDSQGTVFLQSLLQLAKEHSLTIGEVFAVHNLHIVEEDDPEDVLRSEKVVANMQAYLPLTTLSMGESCGD